MANFLSKQKLSSRVKMLSNKAATVFLVVCLDRFRVEMWLKKVHENINMLN